MSSFYLISEYATKVVLRIFIKFENSMLQWNQNARGKSLRNVFSVNKNALQYM